MPESYSSHINVRDYCQSTYIGNISITHSTYLLKVLNTTHSQLQMIFVFFFSLSNNYFMEIFMNGRGGQVEFAF